jgi:Ca2+-binding RTX toxin-like protein
VRRLSATVAALATAALSAFSVSLVAPAARAGAPVMCQGEVATIVGTAGDDTLTGTTAPDVIAGLGGDDTIESGGGLDRICGGQGADTISADAASTNPVYLAGDLDREAPLPAQPAHRLRDRALKPVAAAGAVR